MSGLSVRIRRRDIIAKPLTPAIKLPTPCRPALQVLTRCKSLDTVTSLGSAAGHRAPCNQLRNVCPLTSGLSSQED